jgi:ADP-ribosylglycohydrolase
MNPVNGPTTVQLDRATGAVVVMAVVNALGAGYAFEPRPAPESVRLRGGGLGAYAAGEWVDDTAMALPLLQVVASGMDPLSPQAQNTVAERWMQWRATTQDVAPIIDRVLQAYDPTRPAQSLREAAVALYPRSVGESAGNASLMRTTPLTVGFLDDALGLATAARIYSDLTHSNPEAGDACALWNLAQRHAVLNGEFDLTVGLPMIPEERQATWNRIITQAEVGMPEDFAVRNSWVSQVLQTAWSAIAHGDATGPEHFEATLRTAIAAGGDTATVAAVAGGLLGARWGVSAIPLEWRRRIFGWPGYRDVDIHRDVYRAVVGQPWPAAFHSGSDVSPVMSHPGDGGLLLGSASGLQELPGSVEAVVSLCRLGTVEDELSSPMEAQSHVRVWLEDSLDPGDNPNLDLVARDTVGVLTRLRAQGRTVYLHCDDGRSRTPFIAALYWAEISDMSPGEAFDRLAAQVSGVRRNPVFEHVIRRYTR